MPVQSLECLQADFATALRDGTHAPALTTACTDAQRVDTRLDLYRGNVRALHEKALANAYPVTRALVGDEFFSVLARAYGEAHPSTSGDLNAFGAQLGAFVAAFETAQSLPYLPDIAALEWVVHNARYAADADGLARDRIAALSPQALLAARFTLHPALASCESYFPIASIWRAHQAQATDVLPGSLDRAECALVLRPQLQVDVVESSVAESAALAQLRAGGDMDSAIGAAFARDAQFDFGKALVRWLDLGMLVDMHGRV
jgi:hypothetical protein